MVTIVSRMWDDDGNETVTVWEHPGKRLVMTDDPAMPFALVDEEAGPRRLPGHCPCTKDGQHVIGEPGQGCEACGQEEES